jgi:hypothetical protein
MPPAMAAAMRERASAAAEAAAVEVMPENWGAVRVFLAMSTQWRRAGLSGVPTGLDYAVLPALAGALAVPADADLVQRLAVIEHAALDGMLAKGRH